jgi:hypothetical protein
MTSLYAAVPVLAGVFPFVRAHPIRAAGMAAIVVPLMFFNLMLETLLALVLAVPSDLFPGSSPPVARPGPVVDP